MLIAVQKKRFKKEKKNVWVWTENIYQFQFLRKSTSLTVALGLCLGCLMFALSGADGAFEGKIVGAKKKLELEKSGMSLPAIKRQFF